MRRLDWVFAAIAVWMASLATYGVVKYEKPHTNEVCIRLTEGNQ